MMTEPSDISPAEQEAKTILIVDDDEIVLEMLQTYFSVEGYRVLSATSGLKVINILQEESPDLVLLDIMMPWIDGYELCKAIKRNEQCRHIPVVFLSAKTSEDSIKQGYACGCDGYFVKPLDMKGFSQQIRDLLQN